MISCSGRCDIFSSNDRSVVCRCIESSEEMKDFDRVCVYVDNQFQAEDSFTVRSTPQRLCESSSHVPPLDGVLLQVSAQRWRRYYTADEKNRSWFLLSALGQSFSDLFFNNAPFLNCFFKPSTPLTSANHFW